MERLEPPDDLADNGQGQRMLHMGPQLALLFATGELYTSFFEAINLNDIA
jgi:hypothetical protein